MTNARPAAPPPLRPPLAAYAGAWAALAAVYAALYTTSASGISFGMAVRGAVAAVLPAALLGFVSLNLARRWPWPLEARWHLSLRLVPALAALAAASTAGWFVLIVLEGWAFRGEIRWPAAGIVAWQAVIGGLIYLAIAGAAYAWQNAQRVREEAARAAQADVLRARAELAALRASSTPTSC